MRIESVPAVRLTASRGVLTFLYEFEKVATAYEYDWSKQESFARRAAYLNGGGYQTDRKALAAALRAYNRALGASAAALANIDLLEQPNTLAVVTGQQAAVLTGPGYSIYKAMTAIHLARQQSERLGVPVVPVFWVAGEDHDWHEVASVYVPHGDGHARLSLTENFDADRRSIGMAPIPPSWSEMVDQLEAMLPDTEFKAGVIERVRAAGSGDPALDPERTGGKPTLDDWFARLMLWLFAEFGLVMINPVDPALRALERDFFTRVLTETKLVDAALQKGFDRWEALGNTPTVDRHPGNTNLFTYVGGVRMPLMGDGQRFWIRDREQMGWSLPELLERAQQNPDLFSTNVVLRPVAQGVLLPDLAYVGGPGEISYWGLYRDVFTTLDRQMPVVYPRESYTLIEPPIARILEKQGLTLDDVLHRLDERKREFVDREDRLGISRLFEEFREEFGERYQGLVDVLLQLDPHLRMVTDENRKQIAFQLSKLEEKAKQQHRKNLEVFLHQYDRLKAQLVPDGHGLQERSFSIIPYLAKYGPDLVPHLLGATDLPEPWVHKTIYLGD